MNLSSSSILDAQLARLYRRINYERQNAAKPADLKLANMAELVRRLSDPQLDYPVIHVAGTKGKGSVCQFLGSILQQCGWRVGVYTSPHLETIHQRIQVDGEMISDDELSQILADLEPVSEILDRECEQQGRGKLTFFEVITAAAMKHFSNQNLDAAVLEVGMGGRLDSTNVCQPAACVITNISLDHTRQLGSTVDRIAAEKAGIIKPGIPVVSGAEHPDVIPVLIDHAERNGSELYLLNRDFQVHIRTPDTSFPPEIIASFDTRGQVAGYDYQIDNLELRVNGRHQAYNASLAIAVCQSLIRSGWNIGERQIRSGIKSTQLIGRTEIVSRQPMTILDMAHNAASTAALANTLTNEILPLLSESANRKLIFAASSDKDVAAMLQPLIPLFDTLILTRFANNPRSIPPDDLLQFVTPTDSGQATKHRHFVAQDPQEAWNLAKSDLTDQDLVCIAGSAFLVAELRPVLLSQKLQGLT